MTGLGPIGMPRRRVAPGLNGATGWLNTPPLEPDELRGRIVLYVFWTYTCINWLRMLPYVRAWAAKYRDRGLVIVGVHTPEFMFEQDMNNVRRFVAARTIEFPVALDGEYAIWQAFANHYWPARYLTDDRGVIRHEHFGEGRYAATERTIQQLLGMAGAHDLDNSLVDVIGTGDEAPADWTELGSPESYLGYGRADGYTSAGRLHAGVHHVYNGPVRVIPNSWVLSGAWTAYEDRVVADRANTRIVTRFHARDLHLVMSPVNREVPVRFRVTIDDQPPDQAHGADVGAAGSGVLVEPRMYQLIRQSRPIVDRTVAITFLDADAEAYVMTFG
jgi:thiol-disulfide isomerase/thioredoxin